MNVIFVQLFYDISLTSFTQLEMFYYIRGEIRYTTLNELTIFAVFSLRQLFRYVTAVISELTFKFAGCLITPKGCFFIKI